ncbi:MAG TPA: CpsB/CapC family capsule biosynthesis tyrosine phosphatase [Candidatus Acidoferrales bacterium]|jgi:protein-tyrosine phosphatase|nr:CpsB/CapC family capsule biosynthesis tyrosine phosphatase [Candidatus Acidoferrales bacterium]
MIDIHSHVVWGLDDGATDMEQSLVMLRAAAQTGTTDIVATPHSNAEFRYEAELLEERIRLLAVELGGKPRIHRGCDLHLSFDNIDEVLQRPGKYTIDGKQYLLVECPDFHVGKHMEGVLQRLIDSGIVPIVTHPERNPVLQQKVSRVEEWVELGCLVQVTALSICGGFGRTAGGVANRLLEQGLVHVVASDAHDPEHRHARLDEAYGIVKSRYGEEEADILFTHNPKDIVEGVPLAGGKYLREEAAGKRWWQFWRAAG